MTNEIEKCVCGCPEHCHNFFPDGRSVCHTCTDCKSFRPTKSEGEKSAIHPDDDVCPTCAVGFRLPSGVCDYCNQPYPSMLISPFQKLLILTDKQQDEVVFELYAMIANQGEQFRTKDSLLFAKLMIIAASQNLSLAIQRAKTNHKWKD